MKKLFKRLKVYCIGLFQRKKKDTSAIGKQPKTVRRINHLTKELHLLTNGYNKSISSLEKDYNSRLWNYEKHYRNYQEVYSKYKRKLLTDSALQEAKNTLEPFETALNESGFELEKVKGYMKDDVLQILNEVDSLSDTYTNDLAELIQHDAEELQEIRKAYFEKIASIGKHYKHCIDTEKFMKVQLQRYEIRRDLPLVKRLEMKSEALKFEDLTIERQEVIKTMNKQ